MHCNNNIMQCASPPPPYSALYILLVFASIMQKQKFKQIHFFIIFILNFDALMSVKFLYLICGANRPDLFRTHSSTTKRGCATFRTYQSEILLHKWLHYYFDITSDFHVLE